MKEHALKVNDVVALNQLCNGKTVDELKAMYDLVWNRYDEECRMKDRQSSLHFRRGDKAEWTDSKMGKTVTGIVKTVNDRTLTLHQCSDGRNWRVGYRFIKKIRQDSREITEKERLESKRCEMEDIAGGR